jgi:hypothetical protein
MGKYFSFFFNGQCAINHGEILFLVFFEKFDLKKKKINKYDISDLHLYLYLQTIIAAVPREGFP